MFTIEDLTDQVEVQGDVLVREISSDGNLLHDVFRGDICSLKHHRHKEIVYMYCENNELVIEVNE